MAQRSFDYHRYQAENTTLFVDNISKQASWWSVKNLFSRNGLVTRVFLSRSVRRINPNTFAFVQFYSQFMADLAIRHLHGDSFFGVRLQVKSVVDGRVGNADQLGGAQDNFVCNKVAQQDGTCDSMVRCAVPGEDGITMKSVDVEPVHGASDWINRCVLIETFEPETVETIQEKMSKLIHASRVILISLHQFVLVFGSMEAREETLRCLEMDQINLFRCSKRWAEKDREEKRQILITLRGIPLDLWSVENIRKIAGKIGKVIRVEAEVLDKCKTLIAKVKIETSTLLVINEAVLIRSNNYRVEVGVMEFQENTEDEPGNFTDEQDNSDSGNTPSEMPPMTVMQVDSNLNSNMHSPRPDCEVFRAEISHRSSGDAEEARPRILGAENLHRSSRVAEVARPSILGGDDGARTSIMGDVAGAEILTELNEDVGEEISINVDAVMVISNKLNVDGVKEIPRILGAVGAESLQEPIVVEGAVGRS